MKLVLGRACVATLGKLFTLMCLDVDGLRCYMESINWVHFKA